jgi:integrase
VVKLLRKDDSEARWPRGTLHDLRKSSGYHVAQRVPMHELKALMGHSSIRATEEYYTEPGDDLTQKVDAVFGAREVNRRAPSQAQAG